MNLDDLKPAWQQYKLHSSLEGMSQQSILEIIDNTKEEIYEQSGIRLVANLAMFLILLIGLQGG